MAFTASIRVTVLKTVAEQIIPALTTGRARSNLVRNQ